MEGGLRCVEYFQAREVEPCFIEPVCAAKRVAYRRLLRTQVLADREQREASSQHTALVIDGVAREHTTAVVELMIDAPRDGVIVILVGRGIEVIVIRVGAIRQRLERI